MTDPTPLRQSRTNHPITKELASAEAQISTVDDQIDEVQKEIDDCELQIEALEDELRRRNKALTRAEGKKAKLQRRRGIFIDAVAALRKEGFL